LYKLLPNDTDFTVFRPSGIAGLNFAFGGRLEAYHSWLDTADNLDLKSLQHHGSYVVTLTRRFGAMDLNSYSQRSGDAVFFDWFGSSLIVYRERWALIGEAVATILLIFAIVVRTQRAEVRMGSLVQAVFGCMSLLLVVPFAMTLLGWSLLRLIGRRMIQGDVLANSLLLISLAGLGAAVGTAVLAKLHKHFNLQELSLAGPVVICGASWTIAIMLPAGSYLLFWPLLFVSAGLAVLTLLGSRSSRAAVLGTLPGAGVTILLFAPLAYLLYVFLTVNLISIAAVGLLLGGFFILCVPVIVAAASPSSWRLVVLFLIAGACVCLGSGIAQSKPSSQHPRRDTLLYSVNADDHTAVWISYDNMLDSYTAQYISNRASDRRPIPQFLAGSQRQVLSGPAPVFDLQPPITEIKADKQEGDFHYLHMKVRSQRETSFAMVRFDPSIKLVSAKISGRTVGIRPNSASPILLHGMGTEGADLELTLTAPSGVSFWVSDYSVGLPTEHRRPSDLIAAQGSDETVVCRKYVLETAKRFRHGLVGDGSDTDTAELPDAH
jgi:hypothetical protein